MQTQLTVSTRAAPISPPTVEVASGASWGQPIIYSIQPQPINYYHVTEDKLEMLATMPRKKWGEFTVAALSGMAGAAPGAIIAIYSAYKSAWSFQLFDVIQVLIFSAFVFWFLSQYSMGTKVARDLLEEIKNGQNWNK